MSTLTVQPRPAAGPLLGRLRANPIATSSNRADHLVNRSWSMMLPAMDIRRLLHIGKPNRMWLETLPESCTSVTVALRAPQDIPESTGKAQLTLIPAENVEGFLEAGSELDCVYIADTSLGTRLLSNPASAGRLKIILEHRGAIFVEGRLGCTSTLCQEGFVASEYWVTPHRGSVRTAFPLHQHDLSQFAFRQVLHGNSARNRLISRTGLLLSRAGRLPLFARRRAQLFRPARASQSIFHVPDYLIAAADDAGLDLRGMRWAMSARARYDSNKTIFYLFHQTASQPEIVIKITRAPEFNPRLEHEYHVLRLLRGSGMARAVPEPLFLASHSGLTISAQRAVIGTPFRGVSDSTIRTQAIGSMIDLLVQLGASGSQAFGPAPASECDVFGTTAAQCSDIYALPPSQRGFLQQQAKSIAGSGEALPLVLQHGDTGAWNLIVAQDGRVTLMDWENAETPGVPLWDLLHFLFTVDPQHGSAGGRSEVFLKPSHASRRLVVEAAQKYVRSVAVPGKLLEPLFYLCWAYRSVRESWYLPAGGLDAGVHIRMLRAALSAPDAVSALVHDITTVRSR